ncbi:MAG: P-type conjugative transfer protein TrbJ [Candidatus Accumulibacter sp.]|jgi:P-type conjugative transfer protein TrbJ|nr:P-type conjugative transfer protein TrbJ [Accumulibacter sp.]
MKLKILTAKILTAGFVGLAAPAHAGIPTLDGTNLSQNMVSALESVSQTLKQIEQYKTQLQQYENMPQNTMAPASHIWDQAQRTIGDLMNAVNTLNYYKTQLGSLDKYLARFGDLDYYRNSPCYNGHGEACTAEERALFEENRRLGSESQKKANDALFRTLESQQDALKNDARNLERIQAAAQGADGQMQALGYANQLASHQANQLLQIRGLLMAQQNAIAAKMQVDADREAQQQAAHEASTALRWSNTLPAKPIRWTINGPQ